MFRWLLLIAIAMVTVLIGPSLALAQSGAAGSIGGTVTDQSGNPLRGVKITATSDVLMGPGKVATSNEEGSFHIQGLPPGTSYKVTATQEGMNPAVLDSVVVGITSTTEVNILMEVQETEGETITIIEAPPMISTSKPAIQTKVELKTIQATPSIDLINVFRDVLEMTSGTTASRRVRGAPVRGTLFTQDGFEIKEQFPSARSSAALEIQTAGYGADAPTASGGVVNLVTRSGSNKTVFEMTAAGDATFARLGLDRGEPSAGTKRLLLNPTISGPIVKDRLWYHLNVETLFLQQPQPRDPLLVLPETQPFFNVIPKVTGKVSWQVNSRNKIDVIFNGDWPYQRNNRTNAGISDEAQSDRLAERYFTGVVWQSSLTDALLFRSQVGYGAFHEHIYPSNCRGRSSDADPCYATPNIRQRIPTALEYGNFSTHNRNDLQYVQFINTLEYFLSTKTFGDHNLKLYDKVYVEEDKRDVSQNGNLFYEYAGTQATNTTTFYANDPRLEPPRFGSFVGSVNVLKHQLTASDTWKINRRFTTTPAVSLVQARATNSAGNFPFNKSAVVPAVSLVWDVEGDGKTVLRTSGSVYADLDLTLVGRHTLGTQVSQRCGWNPTTQQFDRDCVFSGGATNTVTQDLKVPRTWEAQLGGARQVAPGVSVSLDGIYRLFTNQFEDFETNRIWNASGTAVLGYRNGRQETILDLQTPKEARREYIGATIAVTTTGGPLTMNAAYTLSRLYGTVLESFQNTASPTGTYYGTIPGQDPFLYGPLADDHRHEIKLFGTYEVAEWLSAGFRYTYYSASPTNRLFYDPVLGTYSSYRATPGVDPGSNLNDPLDDRDLRLPDQMRLDLRIMGRLRPLIGRTLNVFVDVLNVLGLRTATAYGVGDGRDFGLITTRMIPFTFRVGLDFSTDSGPVVAVPAPAPAPVAGAAR
ncbi:MAG TPA: carboxypeptidase-like regulatory domain-containing protein [Polyangiaceae bacterium]|nr:carboxypeptidase-like regulatory domain-containing protein [Polyangiaceae bacterium]